MREEPKDIKFEYEKKFARRKIATILIAVFLVAIGMFAVTNKGSVKDAASFVVYDVINKDEFELGPETPEDEAQKGFEDTDAGLVLRYGSLKQGDIILGKPVKWRRYVNIANPNDKDAIDRIIELQVPHDAKNLQVFIGKNLVSESSIVNLPAIEKTEEITIVLYFETSPVNIEIMELPPETFLDRISGKERYVRVWQDSSLKYYNVILELDLELGEKVYDISEGEQKNIKFDYEKGKAFWTLEQL